MKPIKEPTESQRTEPGLKAEIGVYDALLAIDLEGNLLYDVRVGKQVDMYFEITHKWRGAVEVKGGHHMVKDGTFYRREADGSYTKLKNSPLEQAIAGAMAIRDAFKQRLGGHECWINAVLALPDMAVEDPEITKLAGDNKVSVVWGGSSVEAQWLRIIQDQPDWDPPDELDMEADAAALVRREPPAQWQSRKALGVNSGDSTISADLPALSSDPALPARADAPVSAMYSIVIHNYGTVHINVPDSETFTPHNDVPVLNTGPEDAAPTADPAAHVASVPGDGCEFGDPSVVEADPFGLEVDGNGFNDDDPFS